MKIIQSKLIKLYETTRTKENLVFSGELRDDSYYNYFINAGLSDNMERIMGYNVIGYNMADSTAVLIIFSIPLDDKPLRNKKNVDSIINVMKYCEETFIVLKELKIVEVCNEHMTYVCIIINREPQHPNRFFENE